ncbi:MAG: flagellar basal body-associated FliL family protein, partial [Pseudomonadota bacterium]
FRASLEVDKTAEDSVTNLLPRVVDVLNSYLRAVEVADLQDRSALTRIRAQMLRRVQVVAGGGAVKDLLIMEFVLN